MESSPCAHAVEHGHHHSQQLDYPAICGRAGAHKGPYGSRTVLKWQMTRK